MSYYYVNAVINGRDVNISKIFSSEDEAINYMLNYYNKHYVFNFQVEEQNELSNNKSEFVCDYYNKFILNRIQVA